MFEGCSGCCIVLVLIPLLCCGCLAVSSAYMYFNAPDPPIVEKFTPSSIDAQVFENMINQASNQVQGGRFALTFNQQQISSWMALEGQNFTAERDRAMPLKNIQVGLNDGQMTFYAEFGSSGPSMPFLVIVEPGINDQAKLDLDLTEINLGGIKMPRLLLNLVNARIQDALDEPFKNLPGSYYIDQNSLRIQNGMFYASGGVR